jgi:hypothetical protein
MMASILSAHRFFLCKIQLPVCFAKASITTMEKGEIEKTPRQWGQPEPSQIPPLRSVHPLPVSVAIGNLQGNHGHQNAPPPRLQPPWAEKQLRGTMPFSVHEVDSAGHLDTRMSIGSALITLLLHTVLSCSHPLPRPRQCSRFNPAHDHDQAWIQHKWWSVVLAHYSGFPLMDSPLPKSPIIHLATVVGVDSRAPEMC